MARTAPDGSIYVVDKDGQVGTIPAGQAASATQYGYREATDEEAQKEFQTASQSLSPVEDVKQGFTSYPADNTQAFGERALHEGSFGLLGPDYSKDAAALSRARQFKTEHPYQAMGADVLAGAPVAAAAAVTGGAAAGALGGGLLGGAADLGIGAAAFGTQQELENSTVEGRNFSYTDAAIGGVSAELLGRGSIWALSKALGGTRNLVAGAVQKAASDDVERSLTKGGWLQDYNTAQNAEKYQTALASKAADDMDTLEKNFQAVSGISKKRARIAREVQGDVQIQYQQGVEARQGLKSLRDTLANDPQLGGPGRSLLTDLDEKLTSLEADPQLSGPGLWRTLDETRQVLQNYHVDLAQSLANDPGRAWASREGLAALDAAERGVRGGLVRPDAWGEAAADLQRNYNQAFHEQWFPARKTVSNRLMFSPERDYNGRAVYRGEPGKLGRFLANNEGPDAFRTRELFSQYLDGSEAIVKLGAEDSPQAARDALEAIRRLRRSRDVSTMLADAVKRHGNRATGAELAAEAAGGAVGGVAGGPVGMMAGYGVARGLSATARMGHWLGKTLNFLGHFGGRDLDIEGLLAKGALPAVEARPANAMLQGLADAPFPPADRVAGAVQEGLPGQPQVVPEGAPQAIQPEALAGVGQARRAAGDRPAGMEAIQPQRTVDVGGAPPEPAPPSLPEGATNPDLSQAPAAPREMPPLPQSAMPTLPQPVRTEARAWYEQNMGGAKSEARIRDAQRMADLIGKGDTEGLYEAIQRPPRPDPPPELPMPTEGFHNLMEALDTAGVTLDDGRPMAGVLRDAEQALIRDGRVGDLPPLDMGDERHALVGGGGEAQIHSAMRQLFGPTFGAEDVKAIAPLHILEGLAPVVKSQWRRAGDDVIWSAEGPRPGATSDAPGAGQPLWRINRTYSRESGELRVHHDYFFVNAALQNTGVGERLLQSQMDGYLKLGVRQVDVDCADVGRYYWPSIGFDAIDDPHYLNAALDSARQWFTEELQNPGYLRQQANEYLDGPAGRHKLEGRALESAANWFEEQNPGTLVRELASIKSLPSLANREWGKAFLLENSGQWNFGLSLRLEETDPRFQLMRQRIGLKGEAPLQIDRGPQVELPPDSPSTAPGALAVAPLPLGLAAFAEGSDDPSATPEAKEAAAQAERWSGQVSVLKQARARLVSDVVKRLFLQNQTPAANVPARQPLSRSELDVRRAELESWVKSPQELVQRVSDGLRDVPPGEFGSTALGTFQTAAFIKEKLPQAIRTSSLSLRPIPVSNGALRTFAAYEDAALRPRDVLQRESASGHLSAETLETLNRLYPDLLVDLRVAAIDKLHTDGAPPTVQARVAYGRLFGGDGGIADPAMSRTVAQMADLAYIQSVPGNQQAPHPGGTGKPEQAGPKPPAGISRASQI